MAAGAALAATLHVRRQVATVGGVPFPTRRTVGTRTLQLNGAGVRRVLMFMPYAAALYLEHPTRDAREVITHDQAKVVQLVLLSDLTKVQIEWAFKNAVERNAGERLPAVQERLKTLYGHVRDAKKGETVTLTYVPGEGTRFVTGEGDIAPLPGADLAEAMLGIWFGPLPVDGPLKAAMLGDDPKA